MGCILNPGVVCGLTGGLAFLETNRSQFSTGGCSQRDSLHAPRNSARPPRRRSWSQTIKPRSLGGFEICVPVRLSVAGVPNAREQFCRPRPGDRYPLTRALIPSTTFVWKGYVERTFVKELGRWLLDKRGFVHFIKNIECTDYRVQYGLVASAGVAATASNVTQGPSRGSCGVRRETKQTGPIGYRPQIQPVQQPRLRQCSRSMTSYTKSQRIARHPVLSGGSLRTNTKKVQSPPGA
jgi:hypothetical protein